MKPPHTCSFNLVQTHWFSKWKAHSCFCKESLSQWVSIKAHTAPVPNRHSSVCMCVFVCLRLTGEYLKSVWSTLPEEEQNWCHQREKDWLLPNFPTSFLWCPASWLHGDSTLMGKTVLERENKCVLCCCQSRGDLRQWAERVLVIHVSVQECVPVTETRLVALSTCPCIHHGEKWLHWERRGAVIYSISQSIGLPVNKS